jgi:micrococcal nuclease
MYDYTATVVRVQDGDSAVMSVDLGFRVHVQLPIRLLGLDTPELNAADEKERIAAVLARSFLKGLIEGKLVRLRTQRAPEKYGRWLGEVWLLGEGVQGESVNQMMLDAGHGRSYDGGRREPWGP